MRTFAKNAELKDAVAIESSILICPICCDILRGRPAVRLTSASLRRCLACGSWTYFPRPTPAEQASIHDNDEYFEHPYFQLRR